jgi:hypothetical protein
MSYSDFKDHSPPSGGDVLFAANTRFVLNKAGYSIDQNFLINPKINLFLTAEFMSNITTA